MDHVTSQDDLGHSVDMVLHPVLALEARTQGIGRLLSVNVSVPLAVNADVGVGEFTCVRSCGQRKAVNWTHRPRFSEVVDVSPDVGLPSSMLGGVGSWVLPQGQTEFQVNLKLGLTLCPRSF